ncbi:hypothetical protein N7481_001149 [Penicillium waksmanii]|uniref:uncharacterized protein n=1 Tax=Penicillium waksmanii TaxID=69791 RepID=UPI00254819D0|nr:uncharacterized protein N7481_001149 [Penicillium waksmanii]KAJ6000740.1 hypothetical protein N7481_001149 [Penicillium waksmanii]
MNTTDSEIKSLLGTTISILEKNQDLGKDISDIENLPAVFSKTAKYVPSIRKAFETCKESLASTPLEENYFESLNSALKDCKTKIARLHEIFSEVIKHSDPKAQYRTVAKEDRLEYLMKEILNHTIKILKNPPFEAVLGEQVQGLEQALGIFNAMEPCRVEGKSWHFHNLGNGSMNVNKGSGSQNVNASSGNMFTGSIQNVHLPK